MTHNSEPSLPGMKGYWWALRTALVVAIIAVATIVFIRSEETSRPRPTVPHADERGRPTSREPTSALPQTTPALAGDGRLERVRNGATVILRHRPK